MRLKSIPDDAVKIVENHPYVVGGIVLAAVVGIYLHSSNSANTQSAADTSYDPYAALNLGYSAPIAYPVASNGGTSGTIGGTSSSFDPGAVTQKDLFDFEKLKSQQDYELALSTLEYNSNVAIANATLGMAGIQASNFTAATQLAQSIVGTQATSLTGAIFGPSGLILAYGGAQTLASTSKNSKTLAANAIANQAGQSAFNNFLQQMGNMYVPQSGSSNSNGSTIGIPYGSAAVGSIAGVATSTLDATYYNGGQQPTIVGTSSVANSQSTSSNGERSNVVNNINSL